MRKDIVESWLAARGISLTDTQYAQLSDYQNMVLTAPMNLTAIKTDEDFAVKHFIDSLSVLPWLKQGARCIDIGTGAGFPGVPLKIARPDIEVTLLDSLQKRVLFLRDAVDKLGLTGVECVHARVEEGFAKKRAGMYDLAVARAVANLGKLVEYTMPLVAPGGVFLAMKGPDVSQEIKDAKPILDRMGAKVEKVTTVEIAEEMVHSIIEIVQF